MPKRPDPNHPLADAAKGELDQIAAMLPPTGDPAPAPLGDLAPDLTSTPPAQPQDLTPEPPTPPQPDRFAVYEQRESTLLGRLEAEREEKAKLLALNQKLAENQTFVGDRVNALLAEKRALEQQLEAASLGREFKSEIVDSEQFNEIVRGITPVLKRRDDRIDALVEEIQGLKSLVATTRSEAEQRVTGVRKEVTERLLLRDEPEFQKLLQRKDFQDFLAERIPGSRRTRLQEVQDAYNDGDTAYMKQVATDFRLKGKPQAVDAGIDQPPRAVGDQTPRAPRREEPVSEDDVQRAFEAMNRGDITVAQYKAIRKRQRDQEVAGR